MRKKGIRDFASVEIVALFLFGFFQLLLFLYFKDVAGDDS